MTTIGQNQNSARKKRLRRAGGSYANAFGTATLVTSNLLILAASNVPGVADALSFTLYQPLKGGRASNRAHQPIRPALQSW